MHVPGAELQRDALVLVHTLACDNPATWKLVIYMLKFVPSWYCCEGY